MACSMGRGVSWSRPGLHCPGLGLSELPLPCLSALERRYLVTFKPEVGFVDSNFVDFVLPFLSSGPTASNPMIDWPRSVLYGQKLKWSGADKELFRRENLPGIEVRYITDQGHMLKGQYGG
jgi:hypothetical protein